MILTGTGEEFSGPATPADINLANHRQSTQEWAELGHESKNLLLNMLAIDVPMIAAVNGRHCATPSCR